MRHKAKPKSITAVIKSHCVIRKLSFRNGSYISQMKLIRHRDKNRQLIIRINAENRKYKNHKSNGEDDKTACRCIGRLGIAEKLAKYNQ